MCDLDTTGASSTFRVILSAAALPRILPTLDLRFEEKAVCLKWNLHLVDCDRGTPETVKKRSVSR